MKLFALIVVAALAGAGMPHIALAQVDSREGIALQNQIAELRQEIQLMQQAQQGAGPAQGFTPQPQYQPGQGAPAGGNDGTAELTVRVSALEEQNRQLQGRVDDLANQVQHQHDDLAKQISDLSFKLGQSQPGAGLAGSAGAPPMPPPSLAPPMAPPMAPPPRPVAKPPAAPVRRTAEMALREGNAALARRDYAGAEAAAREAMGARGPHSADAQMLLARAEGGEQQYKASAADFYQAYNHAPRAATAPTALLGVANALIGLNDDRDACQALAKLNAEFPGAAKAGVVSARKRAGCSK